MIILPDLNLKLTLKIMLTTLFLVSLLWIEGSVSWLDSHVQAAGSAQTPLGQTIGFSHQPVVIRQPFQLSLTSYIGGTIRYTVNGALPSAQSTPYQGPIYIDTTRVIRAQVFNDLGQPMGDVYTNSYFVINYHQSIPIISLVTDWGTWEDLHAHANHRGREWERPITIEYFAPGGRLQFSVPAGIRIHGGRSRLHSAKKSFRIYFRKDYGVGKLNYPLFEDTQVTKFDKLVLRAGFNDAFVYVNEAQDPDIQTYTAKYIGDQVVRNLHRDMGQPIAHGNWSLLYLNGQFWGLYNLTERIDLQYFQSYSDDEADWDVVEKDVGWDAMGIWHSRERARDGDYGAWLENQNWIGSTDFSNPGNIGGLEWRVNMENVFSYLFLQAYAQNYDWPRNNWIVYRRKDPGIIGPEAQWRMMVWDAEYSFGSGSQGFKTDLNTLQKAYSPHDSITRILEKPFIHNCALKHQFVNRAREYLGVENPNNRPLNEVGQLSKARVRAEVLKQANIVRPFIQMEADRWVPHLGIGVDLFDQNIQNTLQFVEEREAVVLHHLDELRYQTFTNCR